MQPVPQKPRIWDDVIRTVIFLFGISMAVVFMVISGGTTVGLVFALLFLIVGDRSMRVAWFPYGKLVQSLFWLGASSLFLIFLLMGGAKDRMSAAIIGVMVGFSVWETFRSIRLIQHVLKAKEQTEHQNDGAGPAE